MVFDKKASKMATNLSKYIFRRAFAEVLFVGTVFGSSKISWYITTESSIIFPAYQPILQPYVAAFQI